MWNEWIKNIKSIEVNKKIIYYITHVSRRCVGLLRFTLQEPSHARFSDAGQVLHELFFTSPLLQSRQFFLCTQWKVQLYIVCFYSPSGWSGETQIMGSGLMQKKTHGIINTPCMLPITAITPSTMSFFALDV